MEEKKSVFDEKMIDDLLSAIRPIFPARRSAEFTIMDQRIIDRIEMDDKGGIWVKPVTQGWTTNSVINQRIADLLGVDIGETALKAYVMDATKDLSPYEIATRSEKLLHQLLTSKDKKDHETAKIAMTKSLRVILNARYPGRINQDKNLLCEVEGVPVYLEDFEIEGKFAQVFLERAEGIYGQGTGVDASEPKDLASKRRKIKI